MITIQIEIKPWGEQWIAEWDVEGPDFRAFGTEEKKATMRAARQAANRKIDRVLTSYAE